MRTVERLDGRLVFGGNPTNEVVVAGLHHLEGSSL
jgi:hypothetical protein